MSRILCCIILLLASTAWAQPFNSAGTRFAFGIPETADLQDPENLGKSRIFVTIIGSDSGCGTITSPRGYSRSFTFFPGRVRELELDHGFIHMTDLGKTNKGFTVETTHPINLTVHVLVEYASESTQIWPDHVLDTHYVLSGWSIFNDEGEDNRAQFLIVAPEDDTRVSIFTPRRLLPDIPANTTIDVVLNKGECYIGKVNASLDSIFSTTHVTVRSSKPVNVFTALTCGYVPKLAPACNFMFDNILGRRYWDTVFYLAPTNRAVNNDLILATSEKKSFVVVLSDGTGFTTNQGRLTFNVDAPTKITSSEPILLQSMIQGASLAIQDLSDPAYTTVLPPRLYDDTLSWYAPPAVVPMQPFAQYITVIAEQASADQIMLNGQPLTMKGTQIPIPNSSYFSLQTGVNEGRHTLASPTPLFAIASGMQVSDAFNFLPGGVAQGPGLEKPSTALSIDPDSAAFCKTFDISVDIPEPFTDAHNIANLVATIRYNPTELLLIRSTPGARLSTAATATIDTSIRGTITLTATGSYLTGVGSLIDATFLSINALPSTSVNTSLQLTTDRLCNASFAGESTKSIGLRRIFDTAAVRLDIADFSATQGQFVETPVTISGLQTDAAVRNFSIEIVYDPDHLELRGAKFEEGVAAGWAVQRTDVRGDLTRFEFQSGGPTLSNGKLGDLRFFTYLSDSIHSDVSVAGSFTSQRYCPLALAGFSDTAQFTLELACGEGLIMNTVKGLPLRIEVIPNPANTMITLRPSQPIEGEIDIRLIDASGRQCLHEKTQPSLNTLNLALPTGLSSGYYILELQHQLFSSRVPLLISR